MPVSCCAVSIDVKTAAKLAWARSPPSGVTTKKYSGESVCPTYVTGTAPDRDADPSAGRL